MEQATKHACWWKRDLPLAPAANTTPCDEIMAAAPSVWELITGNEATNWKLLLQKEMERRDLLALFRTCQDGSSMVLDACKAFRVEIHVTEQQISRSRLRAVSRTFRARGKQPSTLVLIANNCARLMYTLGVLLGEGPLMIEVLELRFHEERLPTAVLANIGRACPHLRSLRITAPDAMPSPEHFPALTDLTITCMGLTKESLGASRQAAERIFCSLGSFIPQLISLSLPQVTLPPLPAMLPSMLVPGSVGSQLRELELGFVLCDTLLGLLLVCAPALEVLKVPRVQLESDWQADTQWRRLEIGELNLSSLARLPVPHGLELSVAYSVFCDITAAEPAIAKASRCKNVDVVCEGSLHPVDDIDQSLALRAGLAVMATFATRTHRYHDSSTVVLENWDVTNELIFELYRLSPFVENLRLYYPTFTADPEALLRSLPNTCESIYIDVHGLKGEQIERMCLAAAPRPADAPLSVEVAFFPEDEENVPEAGLFDRIREQMTATGLYPNVRVDQC